LDIDEKGFRKGHDYMTVVCDLRGGAVEYAVEDRKAAPTKA
jgi:transposase